MTGHGAIPLAVVVAALTAGLAGGARGDFDPESWATVREIKVPAGSAGPLVRVQLDSRAYDGSLAGLADLRLVRGEAEEVGYAVHVPEAGQRRIVEQPGRVFNIATVADKAVELTIDLGDSPEVTNRVRLETPSGDFACPVSVEGSDDNRTWKMIRSDGAIFDFPGQPGARFTTVSFPDSRWRYLRVTVSAAAGQKPIKLTGAAVIREAAPPKSDLPLLVAHPVASRTEWSRDGLTEVVLDLGARHLPVSQVAFQASNENFARQVRVEWSDDNKHWQWAGQGWIFRYREKFREEHVSVELAEQFARYLRVTIVNGDDPPLALTGFAVQGRPRYLYFPFESGRQYRLFYGNPQARHPRYEFPGVLARMDRTSAVEGRLGEVAGNVRYIATREAPPPHPWVQRNRWVLYAALGVAVVVLVLVALRAVRRPAGSTPRSDNGSG